MTADEVKAALARAARRRWPDVTQASALPFPEYWRAVTEWLTFHAPHVGDTLMLELVDDFAVAAKEAEERGESPAAPKVSKEVREIWRKTEGARARGLRGAEAANQDAWEHAAERAAETKDFFARRARRRKTA